MKTPLIVANWKANKTPEEAREWLEEVQSSTLRLRSGREFKIQSLCEVVVCAPFICLPELKEQLTIKPFSNLTIHLGAQDISQFEDGPYTGEITGRMLKGLVDCVIVGHSERRKYFKETEEILEKKVEQAQGAGLKVIYCLSSSQMTIPKGVEIVAYEPLFAIGSGTPDRPENANEVAGQIKNKYPFPVLYGGSIKPTNAKDFLAQPNLDGLLVGGASLSATDFLTIIQNAS